MTVDELWQKSLQNIKPLVPLKDFAAWVAVLKVEELEEGKLQVVAYNNLVYSFVKKKFFMLLSQELHKLAPEQEIILCLQNDKNACKILFV